MSTKHWLAIVLLAASLTLLADVIELESGDRVSGELIGIAGNHVSLRTKYAGIVRVPMDDVSTVESEAEFVVVHVDGSRTKTRLAQDVNLADIKYARKDAAFNFVDAGLWLNRLEASLLLTHGNSDTTVYALRGESKLTTNKREQSLVAGLGRDITDGLKNKDQRELAYVHRWFIQDSWFTSTNMEYFADPIKSVDSRIALSGGLGHRFWYHSFGLLTAELGISQVYEDLEQLEEAHPALRWAVDFRQLLLGGKFEAIHEHRVLRIPDENRGIVVTSTNALRYALSNQLDLNLRADVHYESEPQPNASSTDITYVAGIGVSF